MEEHRKIVPPETRQQGPYSFDVDFIGCEVAVAHAIYLPDMMALAGDSFFLDFGFRDKAIFGELLCLKVARR